MTSRDPDAILQSIFGYHDYKPLQREVILNVLQKRDTLAILPTGGGKSLCCQIPAMIFPGLTVVISPLIALMKDQVEQLRELNIPALFLNSSLSQEEYQANVQKVKSGQVKLLYVSPEALLSARLYNLLKALPLDCLVIDEAHCISEWGHDFRPEYRQLAHIRTHFPAAVCLALTATATPRVRLDIQSCLRFEAANEFIASFDRENLLIEVLPKTDPLQQTVQFLRLFPDQSGVIYCFSRQQVDDLAAALSKLGFSALPYHAGMENEERTRNQELFIHDDVQILAATIAFGMGINKPNVRFIVHHDMPKSIESYYQEIGRAGRDGLPAHCLLLFSLADIQKPRYFINQKEEPERSIATQHLNAMISYAESAGCRRITLLAYFGEHYANKNCGMCDNCLATRAYQADITISAQKNHEGLAIPAQNNLVDITLPAQKFLSCVKRSGEIFGRAYIIDVLRGSKGKKVAKFNHQALSTYGIGKDLSEEQWQDIARQLLQMGFLTQDDTHRSLKLTPKAYAVLKSKEPILGVLQIKAAAPSTGTMQPDYDARLFEILRRARKGLADEARLPPYVIFSDKTLAEMARFFPMTEDNLRKINGVGEVKFTRYGKVFLELIREYCQANDLTEKPNSTRRPSRSPEKAARLKQQILIGEAYNAGRSIQELQAEFQIQLDTLLQHLQSYALDGNALRASEEFLALSRLPPGQQPIALRAFQKLGAKRLKPIFEELGGSVNYDDLRILRLHYLCQLSVKSDQHTSSLV